MTNAGLLDCKIAIEEAGWELKTTKRLDPLNLSFLYMILVC